MEEVKAAEQVTLPDRPTGVLSLPVMRIVTCLDPIPPDVPAPLSSLCDVWQSWLSQEKRKRMLAAEEEMNARGGKSAQEEQIAPVVDHAALFNDEAAGRRLGLSPLLISSSNSSSRLLCSVYTH